MTYEEFELIEHKIGWKYEYWDEHAYISPRHNGVMMKIPIKKRRVKSDFRITKIEERFTDELIETFYAAFVKSPEYFNRSRRDVKKSAEKNVKLFFDGERGIPQLEFSRAAFAPNEKNKIAGAMLVSKYKFGYKDEILFVHPEFQRKGLGTALAMSIINALAANTDERFFWSEYQICNSQSAAWHAKFGFVEETDIITARLRWRYFQHEVWRNEQLGKIRTAERLKPSLERAEAEVERLQKLEDEDFDAAWLRWRWDF